MNILTGEIEKDQIIINCFSNWKKSGELQRHLYNLKNYFDGKKLTDYDWSELKRLDLLLLQEYNDNIIRNKIKTDYKDWLDISKKNLLDVKDYKSREYQKEYQRRYREKNKQETKKLIARYIK